MESLNPAQMHERRDRFSLTRRHLLQDYAEISRRKGRAAAVTALRVRSRQYLDVLAFQATGGAKDLEGLLNALDPSRPSDKLDRVSEPVSLGEVGLVLLLQPLDPRDSYRGAVALERSIDLLPKNNASRRFRRLLVQHLILSGDDSRAASFLNEWPDVDREFEGYLRGELSNPAREAPLSDHDEWLRNFNRLFKASGLCPVEIENGEGAAFDRLKCGHGQPTDGKPAPAPSLVSVVVTTFQPELRALRTSVESLLGQTHPNIEIVIVDDCSGEHYEAGIRAIADLDPRIRLLRTPTNGGTYRARNIGFEASRGEYVTGQDDDDWSHPERIQQQLRILQDDPRLAGCKVQSITATADLGRVRLGYNPVNSNASSLFIARDTFVSVGGFIEVRKSADTELAKRIERFSGTRIATIEKPLTIVRIDPDSLSRSEFSAGWKHPARQQFQSSYLHWHRRARRDELQLNQAEPPPVAVPRRFRVGDTFPEHIDVVFGGDWRQYGGPQKSMIEEIRALLSRKHRVAVLHMEASRFMSAKQTPLCSPIQEMINSGAVHELLYDDPVRTDLLILRYPPILQFPPVEPSRIQASRVLILANQAPSELDGSDVRYLVPDCHQNARCMFGAPTKWVPQGPLVRDAIAPYLSKGELAAYDMPGILDPEDWWTPRVGKRSSLPVIGRHSRDTPMKWPEDPDVIRTVYPTDGRYDVRILGGAETPKRVLGRRTIPGAWTVHRRDALSVNDFLASLDFFVFYQHSTAVEAFGRAILEALAARVVAILPPQYERVFGAAAVYADPEGVDALVRRLHGDRAEYAAQVERAQQVIRSDFSHESYGRLVDRLLRDSRKGQR